MFRILLIESQLLFARALAQVLSSDASIHVSSILRCIDDLPSNATQSADLVLVDIDGYGSGIATLFATCRQRVPNALVCALSSFVRPELMQHCFDEGANGFIGKETSVSELISAMKTLATGLPYVDPRVAGGLSKSRSGNREISLNELSRREIEVTRLIARGLSNRDIGENLFLSEKTIKNHITRIFAKLQISRRTGVAVYALRAGIV